MSSQFEIMVGISTRQNTTNVFPALQLGIMSMLFLETEFARKKDWSKGSIEVLKQRGLNKVESQPLSFGQDSRIDHIKKSLYKQLATYESVVFNLGGGQKAQQIAVWEVFKVRNNPLDAVCYANMDLKKIELWQQDKSYSLHYQAIDFNSSLRISEILTIFGKEMKNDYKVLNNPFQNELYELYNHISLKSFIHGLRKGKKRQLNQEADDKILKMLPDYFLNANRKWLVSVYERFQAESDSQEKRIKAVDFMTLCYEKLKKTAFADYYSIFNLEQMSNSLGQRLLKLIEVNKEELYLSGLFSFLKNDLTKLDKALRKDLSEEIVTVEKANKLPIGDFQVNDFAVKICGNSGLGFLFESVFLDWFENSGLQNLFVEGLANVSVKGERIEAEHDLLLATKSATLISIDAKTGGFDKKDLDARIQNLANDSGDYARMAVVIPFDQELYQKKLIQGKVMALLSNISASIPILTFGYEDETILLDNGTEFVATTPKLFFSRLA
jgi:hypothetical protein